MRNVVEIECSPELLIGLHANAKQFAERLKREAAYGLLHDGAISSGISARWLGVPSAHFPFNAMRHGVTLLDNFKDDFRCGAPLP